jgi:hypothetical protein
MFMRVLLMLLLMMLLLTPLSTFRSQYNPPAAAPSTNCCCAVNRRMLSFAPPPATLKGDGMGGGEQDVAAAVLGGGKSCMNLVASVKWWPLFFWSAMAREVDLPLYLLEVRVPVPLPRHSTCFAQRLSGCTSFNLVERVQMFIQRERCSKVQQHITQTRTTYRMQHRKPQIHSIGSQPSIRASAVSYSPRDMCQCSNGQVGDDEESVAGRCRLRMMF